MSYSYGSGGGIGYFDSGSVKINGGRSGGKIVLSSPMGTINIDGGGLLAEGNPGMEEYQGNYGGSGSGGTISITAYSIIASENGGVISVRGGDSYFNSGGAGGGGRITIQSYVSVNYVNEYISIICITTLYIMIM